MGNPIGDLLRTLDPNSYFLIVKGEQGVSPQCRRGQEKKLLGTDRMGRGGPPNKKTFP